MVHGILGVRPPAENEEPSSEFQDLMDQVAIITGSGGEKMNLSASWPGRYEPSWS